MNPCRCCNVALYPESVSFSLNMKENRNDITIREKLLECVPEMKIISDSNAVICVSCYSLLRSAYDFRKICLDSVKAFSHIEIKKENDSKKSVKTIIKNTELLKDIVECQVSIDCLPKKISECDNTIFVCENCKSLFLTEEKHRYHLFKGVKCYGKCLQCNISFHSNVIFEMHMKFMHSQPYSRYKLKDLDEISISLIKEDDRDECVDVEVNNEIDDNIDDNIDDKIGDKIDVDIEEESEEEDTQRDSDEEYKEEIDEIEESEDDEDEEEIEEMEDGEDDENAEEDDEENDEDEKVKVKIRNKLKIKDNKPKSRSAIDLTCIFCIQQFPNTILLQQHFESHKQYCFQCVECKGYEINMVRHRNYSDCDSMSFSRPQLDDKRCPFCFKYYADVHSLENHVVSHKTFRLYCYKCHILFNTHWEMALHYIATSCICTQFSNEKSQEPPFSCPLCSKNSFLSRKSVQHHFVTHSKNTTVCATCNQVFVNKISFTLHYEQCQELNVQKNLVADVVCMKEENLDFFESDDLTSDLQEQMNSTRTYENSGQNENRNVISSNNASYSINTIDDDVIIAENALAKDISDKLQNIIMKMNPNRYLGEPDVLIEDSMDCIIENDVDESVSDDVDMVTSTT